MSAQRTTTPKEIIPELVAAALGAQTFRKATRALSEKESDSLSRAIGGDVEAVRAEFLHELRSAGMELIQDLRRRKDELKVGEISFALSVVTDKAAALEGRQQLSASSVNIQINNIGSLSKDALLSALDNFAVGKPIEAEPVSEECARDRSHLTQDANAVTPSSIKGA